MEAIHCQWHSSWIGYAWSMGESSFNLGWWKNWKVHCLILRNLKIYFRHLKKKVFTNSRLFIKNQDTTLSVLLKESQYVLTSMMNSRDFCLLPILTSLVCSQQYWLHLHSLSFICTVHGKINKRKNDLSTQ